MRSKCLIGAMVVLILTNFIVQSTAIEMIEQSSMSTQNGKTLYVGGSGPGIAGDGRVDTSRDQAACPAADTEHEFRR